MGDKATGREQNIVIQPSGGLTKDEINNMVNQSEAMKEQDMKKREGIELKNQLDGNIFNIEKSLNDHKANVGQEVIDEVENAIREAKEAINSEDVDRMNQAKTNLDN